MSRRSNVDRLSIGALIAVLILLTAWLAHPGAVEGEIDSPSITAEPESAHVIFGRAPIRDRARSPSALDSPTPIPVPEPVAWSVVVRNLSDGTALAGFALECAGGPTGTQQCSCDELGRLEVAPETLARLRPVDGAWTLANVELGESEHELWVYRSGSVSGTVEFEAGTDEKTRSAVRVDWIWIDSRPPDGLTERGRELWTAGWPRSHVRAANSSVTEADAQGSFRISVPMVHGIGVRAMTTGARVGLATPAWDERSQSARVVLAVQRAPSVTGRVVDGEGEPLNDAQILVIVRKDEFASDHDFARTAAAASGGVTSITFPDAAVVSTYHVWTRTNSDGRFATAVPVSGTAVVIVYAKGHRPVDHRLCTGDRDEIELVAASVEPTSSVVEYRGLPLTSGVIAASDLSYPVEQPNSGWLPIDASGRVDTTWMVEGRLYAINVRSSSVPPSKRGVIRWTGQRRLELDDLTMDGFELTRERAELNR